MAVATAATAAAGGIGRIESQNDIHLEALQHPKKMYLRTTRWHTCACHLPPPNTIHYRNTHSHTMHDGIRTNASKSIAAYTRSQLRQKRKEKKDNRKWQKKNKYTTEWSKAKWDRQQRAQQENGDAADEIEKKVELCDGNYCHGKRQSERESLRFYVSYTKQLGPARLFE